MSERWGIILRHCRLAVEEWGVEDPAMRSMRARLMAYTKGFPASKQLREKFQHVSSLAEVSAIADEHLAQCRLDAASKMVAA
jgi:tRNA-dihydrouridine synthase B